ncbi:MAG TPA: hypothetical protein VGP47_02740, partial [Parachlamydiaceae bacterium]|nr:hypothetical protein [Parachlamydiaceae bacterium]
TKSTRMNYFPPAPKRANSSSSIKNQPSDIKNPHPSDIKGIDVVKNTFFLGFTLLCPPFLIGYAVTAAFINLLNKNEVPINKATEAPIQDSRTLEAASYLSGYGGKQLEVGESGWHLLGKTTGLQGKNVTEVLEILIDTPDTIAQELSRPNKDGYSPLHLAAQNTNVAFFGTLFPSLQGSSILTENNIHLSFNTDDNAKVKTPVHILVENLTIKDKLEAESDLADRVGIIFYCIASNAPELLLQKDENGNTPLQFAQNLIKEGNTIPSEILYYLEHPDSVRELSEAKLQETQKKFNSDKQINELHVKLEDLNKNLTPNENTHTDITGDESKIKTKDDINIDIKNYRNQTEEILQKYTPISVKTDFFIPLKIKTGIRNQPYPNGNNHMHDLALNNHSINDLQAWIGKGEQTYLNSPNADGKTPVHLAIENDNSNFIEIACDPTIRYNIIDWNADVYKNIKPISMVLDKLSTAQTREDIDKFSRMAYLVIVKNSDSVDNSVLNQIEELISTTTDDYKKNELIKLKTIFEKSNLFLEARLEKSSADRLHSNARKQYSDINEKLDRAQEKVNQQVI